MALFTPMKAIWLYVIVSTNRLYFTITNKQPITFHFSVLGRSCIRQYILCIPNIRHSLPLDIALVLQRLRQKESWIKVRLNALKSRQTIKQGSANQIWIKTVLQPILFIRRRENEGRRKKIVSCMSVRTKIFYKRNRNCSLSTNKHLSIKWVGLP